MELEWSYDGVQEQWQGNWASCSHCPLSVNGGQNGVRMELGVVAGELGIMYPLSTLCERRLEWGYDGVQEQWQGNWASSSHCPLSVNGGQNGVRMELGWSLGVVAGEQGIMYPLLTLCEWRLEWSQDGVEEQWRGNWASSSHCPLSVNGRQNGENDIRWLFDIMGM